MCLCPLLLYLAISHIYFTVWLLTKVFKQNLICAIIASAMVSLRFWAWIWIKFRPDWYNLFNVNWIPWHYWFWWHVVYGLTVLVYSQRWRSCTIAERCAPKYRTASLSASCKATITIFFIRSDVCFCVAVCNCFLMYENIIVYHVDDLIWCLWSAISLIIVETYNFYTFFRACNYASVLWNYENQSIKAINIINIILSNMLFLRLLFLIIVWFYCKFSLFG